MMCILDFKGMEEFMCGIVGMVNYDMDIAPQQAILARMTQTLRHRGPDASGYHSEAHVLLGHRRLVVVDPAGGAQPMQKVVDGATYTIVYNGELYNTEELRAELIARGFEFDSYSDTEVLLCAYIAWGTDCARRLNGIFSFGVWDSLRESLFLCRDPLGVKPLYYTNQNGVMIFASELKAILAHPDVQPVIDEIGIYEIMGLGPAHSESSGVFKGIYQLPAAHFLLHTRNKTATYEYWALACDAHTQSEDETAESIRFLLLDAVKRQMFADVPVCTFLSGGLDSSIISAIAAEELKKQGRILDTFSVEYENNGGFYQASDFTPAPDDAWVDIMSAHIGSTHRRVILDNGELASALLDAARASDMPGMADINSSLLLFCKEVRKHATVALSGECADEIFGGYPWYVRKDLAHAGTFPWSGAIKERCALLSPELSQARLAEYVQAQYAGAIEKAPVAADMTQEEAEFRKLFYLNVKWFMNTLLTRKDRMSMATSLEVRVPFADHRLVQYAFNIPRDMLFYGGREKGLLRKALSGILPDAVLWRKKSPYPKTFNPQYVGAVCAALDGFLRDSACRIGEILDLRIVRELIDTQGKSLQRPWFGQLMTGPQLIAYLVQLELWMRMYGVRVRI